MSAVSRVPLAAVTMLTALALAGCGDGGAPERAFAPEPRQLPTHTATATPEPTPSTTAAPGPTRRPGHKVGTLAPRTRTSTAGDVHLLAADRLPTIGGRAWTIGTDQPVGPVGACQKTALETIGAMSTASRSFTADDGLTATQLVARFPDARSAWRAHQVLVAWRDDCESRVQRSTVGPLQPVTVRTGTGDSYRGSFRARSAGLGILRTGSYLTMVEVAADGDRYPRDWDPARVAVRRIARTF
jgi:hypothetical protein